MSTTISGKSGKGYAYNLHEINDFFNHVFETVPGNYIFASTYKDPNSKSRYKAIYIGQVPDLSDCLSYQYQTQQEINEKKITHIYIHPNANQADRLNEAYDLIRKYIRFQPGRITEKWSAAREVFEKEMNTDELAIQEQEDLYDFLSQKGYKWHSNKKIFTKVNRIHPPTLDLELQVRARTPKSPSALRLRYGTTNIFELEKKLRKVLENNLTFYKKFSNTLDPPNSNDTYLYLYTDIKDTIKTSYQIIHCIESSSLNLRLSQFHQRKERGNTNQPFIDLRFGFSVTGEELELLRFASRIYNPFYNLDDSLL